ncbi:MAG: HlyC/CorC family transporter [Acidobacteria bacterium]|nr:HlyC/CorC family transporter [Acidobacteriota bacterium]
MQEGFGYNLLLIAVIVGMNAFFAAAEVALVSCRPSRLRELAAEGHVGAHAALNLLGNSERLLSVVQVGVTICSLALGVFGEKPVEEMFVRFFTANAVTPLMKTALTIVSVAMSYLLLTYIHVVLGEVVPKNVGIEKRDRLAIIVSPILLVFARIVGPFVYALEKSAAFLSRLIGVHGGQPGSHSVEELKMILGNSRRDGILEGFAEKAMQRLIELQEYLTREIMVPRNQIVSAPVDASLDQLLRIANEHLHTRIPIYQNRPENLIGYVHVKDLLRVWEERTLASERRSPLRPFDLRRLVRTLPVVPESKPVIQLLDEFRAGHSHLSMVVDEFGTIVGLVTLEDVVEQIFGEIEDEHDARRPQVHSSAAEMTVEGTTPIRDLELQHGIQLPSEAGYETLAGFLMFRLGRIPRTGDKVLEDGRTYEVIEMERNRVTRVKIVTLAPPPPAEPAELPPAGH